MPNDKILMERGLPLIVAALFLFSGAGIAEAQMFHVTGTHDRTAAGTSRGAHTRVVVGTVTVNVRNCIPMSSLDFCARTLRYTLEEAAMFAPRYTVGADYPVVKLSNSDMTLVSGTGKNARPKTDKLRITDTEEVAK